MAERWIRAPLGIGADKWITRTGCRTVLVVVAHMAAGTRLLDVLPLLEADHRIQVTFTVPDTGDGWHATDEFVRAQGGLYLPWQQAIRHEFDLVLVASHTAMDRVHGPVLLLPHGSGATKSLLRVRSAGAGSVPTHGLDRQMLMRDGRLVPAALALTHDDELRVLRESCPEAVPRAVVAGDPCLDRMLASVPLRESYRRALGVGSGQRLVTVSSTWTAKSAFGRHPDLFARLLAELTGRGDRVAAILHPNIWAVHGRWQVRAWLADCLRAGLILLPPEEGWRAAVVASDAVIGDHGSVTRYAAALGVPVAMAAFPTEEVRPSAPARALADLAARIDLTQPIEPQLPTSTDVERQRAAGALLSSAPGRSGAILRRTMYRLLDIPEPVRAVPVSPVPLPRPVPR
ncbi:hypothetical protein [Allokutzneria oryzae]|uniref:CDP-Glycerol:Poly(Glycerophosphate) glycerophosphotransferase n=1 Tax=Allokutzneria oryzae TaxID=1378989 RepID=A0ABV6ACX3_9PSEU